MDDSTLNMVWGILSLVLGAGWSAFKTSEYFTGRMTLRQRWLTRIAVSVVRHVYFSYVRALKKDKAFGDEQKDKARVISRDILRREIASAYGNKVPDDIADVMTNDKVADSVIESAVSQSKNEAKITPEFVAAWFKKYAH